MSKISLNVALKLLKFFGVLYTVMIIQFLVVISVWKKRIHFMVFNGKMEDNCERYISSTLSESEPECDIAEVY